MNDQELLDAVGLGRGSDRLAPTPADGRWWWHRHYHIPVAVWIAASVLVGAAIGAALETGGSSDEVPATTTVACAEVADADADAGVGGPPAATASGTDCG